LSFLICVSFQSDMPSEGANIAVQVIEVLSGSLSAISCIAISRKIWRERTSHVTNQMLLSLFFIDFVLGIVYAIGRSATFVSGLCQFQGFLLQWFEVAALLWNILMAYLMYQWIVMKKHPKRMEKTIKKCQIALFAVTFVLAVGLLAGNTYGSSYLWCWITIEYEWARVAFFEIILLIAWITNMVMLQVVFASLNNRLSRHNNTSVHAKIGSLLDSTIAIQRKLVLYVAAFLFLWSFPLINRFVEYGTGETNVYTSILQVIFLPLQGFVNALLYGDYIDYKKISSKLNVVAEFSSIFKNLGNKGGRETLSPPQFHEVIVEPTPEGLTKVTHQATKRFVPKKYSIFITTLNVGEASLASIVGDIKDWIVEGHDVYAIGLQECIDLHGLREAILNRLGGPEKYTMFTTSIGSGNTRLGYHGFIALTMFVKTSELLSGNIQATDTTSKTMATGTDLIITTAQNKGAVGIPLQIHDTSIGFVTCHLPSDSKGKSKLTKRNASAHAILKEVILAPEDLGYDLHLQHDHILVFGDLNYRMETDGVGGGVNSLTGVSVACQLEKSVMHDDNLWVARKYNLLRHHSDPLHPSIEEVKLIQQAKINSRGAWKSVLRADELRSIMDDGDAFYGFDEPMPSFPPSYKRKKGKVEGACGDYSNFNMIIKGFSHTGYVENILDRPPSTKNIAASSSSSFSRSMNNLSLKLSAPLTSLSSDLLGNNSGHGSSKSPKVKASTEERTSKGSKNSDENEGEDSTDPATRNRNSSGSGSNKNNNSNSLTKNDCSNDLEGSSERSSESGRESDIDEHSAEKLEASRQARKNRRKALLNKEAAQIVETEEKVHETDPSKLRPPSYTDRILIHSLPDRRNRLTVQAYDFCDTLRVSDHRAISMTVLLEVNANCIYNGASDTSSTRIKPNTLGDSSSATFVPPPTKEELILKEPKFELYELIITDLSVIVLDLKFEEVEGEDDEEDSLASDLHEVRRLSEQRLKGKEQSSNAFEEINPMFKQRSASPTPPTRSSPISSPPSSSSKKKKVGGVKFSAEDANNPSVEGADIEMQSVEPSKSRIGSNTTEKSNDSVDSVDPHHQSQQEQEQNIHRPLSTKSNEEEHLNNNTTNSSSSNSTTVVRSPGKKPERKKSSLPQRTTVRKKSIFAVFWSGDDRDDEEQEAEEEQKQKDLEVGKTPSEDDEDAILKDMTRESLNWTNDLHQPGEWRKRRLEEQRMQREKDKESSISLNIPANSLPHKKKHKSDDKMIHMLTVVFPLPTKDPLLVYRRIFDYSQAFDIADKSQRAFDKNE
jgi:hypothetical protein